MFNERQNLQCKGMSRFLVFMVNVLGIFRVEIGQDLSFTQI